MNDTLAADEAPDAASRRTNALAELDAFVAGVIEECRTPGAQQALRLALGRPLDEVPSRTHAALMRPGLLPYNVRDKRPYYAVAALIAARPRAQRPDAADPGGAQDDAGSRAPYSGTFRAYGTNLGESIAQAVIRDGDSLKENGAERRLHLMARQDADGLHHMLPGVVRLVSGTGVSIDYACLLRDLRSWSGDREAVTVRWLESYYRTLLPWRKKKQAKNAGDAG